MYYNPNPVGYVPGARMSTYPQPYTQPYPQPFAQPAPGLKGRQVSSIDEVRAAQIDFDGAVNYFPCPAQQTVYGKYIDMNTGNAVILEYKLQPEQPAQAVQYADSQTVQELADRVSVLENLLSQGTGVANHDANGKYNTNAAKHPAVGKSTANDAANVRK